MRKYSVPESWRYDRQIRQQPNEVATVVMPEPRLRKTVNHLYTGRSRSAVLFRYGLIAFDVFTIAFFVASAAWVPSSGIQAMDAILGVLILGDLLARLWIAPRRLVALVRIHTIADMIVVLSLLLAPLVSANLAFLRILRTVRLLYSYQVLHDLRRDTPFFRRNEEVIVSAVNLAVFIFVITAFVFVFQFGENPGIGNYLDALYFTVSTLTTTGFGDITLTGTSGRLISVLVMIGGVALFLRLAQAIFRPRALINACPDCGLRRHEPDAVHCRRCGHVLKLAGDPDA